MSKAIPVIIFVGAPGAGKGTQAMHLSAVKSIPKISTGDMLRQAVKEESELGQKVQEIMKEGRLVDDETMLRLVLDRIARPDCANGFILDGYPRNSKQATQLEQFLRPDMKLMVFNINVSEDEIIKRLTGRRTCPNCERIYNIHFHPPADDVKCDVDGSPLVVRADDSEDVIRKRIETYRRETFPLIQHFQDLGVLHGVDGVQSEEVVVQQILQRFEE